MICFSKFKCNFRASNYIGGKIIFSMQKHLISNKLRYTKNEGKMFSIKDFFSKCDQIRRKLKRYLPDIQLRLIPSFISTSSACFLLIFFTFFWSWGVSFLQPSSRLHIARSAKAPVVSNNTPFQNPKNSKRDSVIQHYSKYVRIPVSSDAYFPV